MINTLLETELQGLYGDHLAKISQINKWYKIYDGDQEWDTVGDLDYRPTKKITNLIKGLIDTRARFMFGREPFFDIRPVKEDEDETTTYKDEAQAKSTFPALLGMDGAKAHLRTLSEQMFDGLAGYGEAADALRALARLAVERDH